MSALQFSAWTLAVAATMRIAMGVPEWEALVAAACLTTIALDSIP
jgi:hypothetical protein